MKYLIIYANPNPQSYCHAIKEVIQEKLKQSGRPFEVRDLYAMKYNAILATDDFSLLKQGKQSEDIAKEQAFIRAAETLIFIYPIWWFSMPAILKGYIDRVFSYGFAYAAGENGIEGRLGGKKVMIFNTTGGTEENYEKGGFRNALKLTMEAGTFEFCGMNIILHKFFFAVPAITREQRVKMLEDLKKIEF